MKNLYELMFITRAYLPDNVRNDVYSYIEKTINDLKGSVKLKDIWGKRYMAHKIGGQKEGYYVVYQIEIDSAEIENLKYKLGRRGEIVRFMISTLSKEEVGVSFGKKEASNDVVKPQKRSYTRSK